MATHEKAETATTESPAGSHRELQGAGAPRKRGGCVGLLKRFWWLLLIGFIIGTLIVVLPFIYVGIPNIAQGQVNKSSLDITNQVVSDPKPNSVNLALTNVAKSNSSFHPSLGEFKAALFLENTEPNIAPFAYITIPASKVNKETTINVDQNIDIVDMDQFKAYNKLVVESETYRVAVRGRVPLKLSGLKAFTVDYNKAVTMKGLNGLAGFAVKNFTILLKPESDGANMIGQVYIPNPSVLTVEMGNVTLDLSVAGTAIGQSLIPNLTLKPGDNTLDMRSTTDQSAVLKLISSTYKDGILPIDIVGNSSVNSAGEHLTYFESAIQGNKMSTKLDVGKALAAIGLNITSI